MARCAMGTLRTGCGRGCRWGGVLHPDREQPVRLGSVSNDHRVAGDHVLSQVRSGLRLLTIRRDLWIDAKRPDRSLVVAQPDLLGHDDRARLDADEDAPNGRFADVAATDDEPKTETVPHSTSARSAN